LKNKEKTATTDFDRFNQLDQFNDYMEKGFLEHKLEKTGWNLQKTAELLNISKETLQEKMSSFGLQKR
jgi:DNA-binding NtrC family response regulator